MRTSNHHSRGSALLPALMLTPLLVLLTATALLYASRVSNENIQRARQIQRSDCAQSGLAYARAFYQSDVMHWNTFLGSANYKSYNALDPSNWPNPPVATDPFATGPGSLQALHPELFADIDGDGANDVYIYIRDNMDEATSTQDFRTDIDQKVYIGALCISSTLNPHPASNIPIKDFGLAEGLFTGPTPPPPCTQAGCGNGANNYN